MAIVYDGATPFVKDTIYCQLRAQILCPFSSNRKFNPLKGNLDWYLRSLPTGTCAAYRRKKDSTLKDCEFRVLTISSSKLFILRKVPDEMIASDIAVALVAFLHVGFLILEMFLWDSSLGRKTFKLSREDVASPITKKLFSNQGLYNGFLATGLAYGLVTNKQDFKVFHLSCVVIAGLFGAYTVKRSILYLQALPALIALVLLHYNM